MLSGGIERDQWHEVSITFFETLKNDVGWNFYHVRNTFQESRDELFEIVEMGDWSFNELGKSLCIEQYFLSLEFCHIKL